MEEELAFFELSKAVKRVQMPGGQTRGCAEIKEEDMFPDPSENVHPSKGYSYIEKYIARENLLQQQVAREEVLATPVCGLGDVDDQTSIGGSMALVQQHFLNAEETMRVFDQYNFEKKMKITLPITSSRSKIMKVVDSAQTSIIQGKTGCGKSTQVPQFIMESCRAKRLPCNIIVTQPRRIAAISLARRVCAERDWPLGSLVGYMVGMDHEHKSEDTRLMYCTTGVLLQMVVAQKTLTKYTHIILDEVHERTKDMDFLIIIIKKLLYLNSKNVKVILMSATIDVRHFSQYFLTPMGTNMEFYPSPIVDLDTVDNPFLIEIFYLCSLKNIVATLPDIRHEEPGITLLGYRVAMKLIESFDRIEQASGKTLKQRGAVLVFLPGIHEIEELFNMLMTKETEHKWWVKPLHSTITTSEQEIVFKRPPEGYRKVILSTNIAESSITVPDITFVVDFVLTKTMVCDPNTNFQSLQLGWASKSNCIQRSGRAGRVAAGRVFRLVPKAFYDCLPNDNVPEIQRGSLEQTVLLTKLLDMGPPKAILALALDPPDLTRIEQTILTLKEKGALLRTSNRRESMTDGDITLLGRVMAKLPVDPIISKLIMLGHVFSVMRECIIMGAAMSLKSVFSTPFQERLKAYHSKLTWADSSCSDCISFLNAYTVWAKNKEIGYFKRSVGGGEAEWAQRYNIQLQTMHEVHQLVQEIQSRLINLKIEIPVAEGRVQLSNVEKPLVLKIVLAGAFYPNYYVRSSVGGQVNEREAVKVLDGRDPFSTVYLQNFPGDQPRRLYTKRIKEALQDCCPEIQVSFDSSSKVYVQFGQHQYPGMEMHNHKYVATIPGKVAMGVYRAVKFRQLAIPIMIPLLKPAEAKKRAEQLGLPTSEAEMLLALKSAEKKDVQEEDKVDGVHKKIRLPGIDTSYIKLVVAYVVDAGHFWAQTVDLMSTEQQVWMYKILADEKMLVPLRGKPVVGNVYAARYMDESQKVRYYRARVESITSRPKNPVIQIFYLDYGNSATINEHDLRDFGPALLDDGILQIPAQAFECMMANIQPSAVHNDTGLWSGEADKAFKKMTANQVCYGNVYSVVNGVIHLELLTVKNVSINGWLIKQELAIAADESFLSQENHKLRVQQLQPFEIKHYDVYQNTQTGETVMDDEIEPPRESECNIKLKLKGPTSPLEMQVYGLTRVGMRREVAICRESVNSVLLDTDPQDPHERLLVAACVGENADGTRINLRHTTLMPNIHGLAALICLIFSPAMELRTNPERTRYTGAICGLGINTNTGKSLFLDHDMEVNFDTEMTQSDVEEINRVRLWMNECLVPDDPEVDVVPDHTILNAQRRIKECLFKLIQRKQVSCELSMAPKPLSWGVMNSKYMMPPSDCDSTLAKQMRAVFRLHWGVRLKMPKAESLSFLEMLERAQELKKIASGLIDPRPSHCIMCNLDLEKRNVIRAHLATFKHRDKERQIRTILELDD